MKAIILSIVIAGVLVGGVLVMTKNKGAVGGIVDQFNVDNNVAIVEGVQIINIYAKGGYLPRKSVAKAGIPTVIRFDTNGTFDCSSSVRIPSLDISKSLPMTGTTDIDIGIQQVTVLKGTCSMGMYPFEVEFKS